MSAAFNRDRDGRSQGVPDTDVSDGSMVDCWALQPPVLPTRGYVSECARLTVKTVHLKVACCTSSLAILELALVERKPNTSLSEPMPT